MRTKIATLDVYMDNESKEASGCGKFQMNFMVFRSRDDKTWEVRETKTLKLVYRHEDIKKAMAEAKQRNRAKVLVMGRKKVQPLPNSSIKLGRKVGNKTWKKK